MRIIPKNNEFIERQYGVSWYASGAVFYGFCIAGPFIAIATYGIALLVWLPALYFLFISHRKMIRVDYIDSDRIVAVFRSNGRQLTLNFSKIVRVIDFTPFSEDAHCLFIAVQGPNVLDRVLNVTVPAGQGIIEHLKDHGVKVRNLWFWQEKD
jgi:hypothetical protein